MGLRRAGARLLGRSLRRRQRARDDGYCARTRELLARHGLAAGRSATTSSARRSATHRRPPQVILPPRSGATATRRRPAARRRGDEEHRPRRGALRRAGRHRLHRVADLALALLVPAQRLRGDRARATSDFAERWSPIIDVFDAEGVRFALEVHPTEIAYDFVTTRKALDAIGHRRGLRHQLRPEPPRAPVPRLRRVHRRVRRPHLPRPRQGRARRLDGRARSSAATCNFGDADRGWDFVSPGHGDVDFEDVFRALNRVGYEGPLSIEWEDSGMDREYGARDALAFVRRTDFAPSARRVRRRIRPRGLVAHAAQVVEPGLRRHRTG